MPARKTKASKYVDDEAEDIHHSEEEEEPVTPKRNTKRSKTTPPSAPTKAGSKSPAGVSKPRGKKPLLTKETASRVLVIRKPSTPVELGTQTSFKNFQDVLKSEPNVLNTVVVANKSDKDDVPFRILFKEFGFFVELEHYLPKLNNYENTELLFKADANNAEGASFLEFLQRADNRLAQSLINSIGTEAGLQLKQNLLVSNVDYPKLKFAKECIVKSDVQLTDSQNDEPTLELMNELANVEGSSRKTLRSKLLIKVRPYAMAMEGDEDDKKYQFGFSAKVHGMRILEVKERQQVEVVKFNLDEMLDEL